MSLESKFKQKVLENKFLEAFTLLEETNDGKLIRLYRFNRESPIVTLEIGNETEEIDVSNRPGLLRLRHLLTLNRCETGICDEFKRDFFGT